MEKRNRLTENRKAEKRPMGEQAENRKAGKRAAGTMEAYLTLEAAMIMGFCLVLFVFLISLAFFMYDRCLFNTDCYLLCFRESYRKEEADLAQELKSLSGRQFGTKYFSVSDLSVSAEEDGSRVSCSIRAGVIPDAFRYAVPMPSSFFEIRAERSARKTDPVLRIRRVRRIFSLGGQIAGAAAGGN